LIYTECIWHTFLLPLPQGCLEGTRSALEIAAYTLGGLGIAFGIVEIIGVLISIGLICVVTKSKEQTVV